MEPSPLYLLFHAIRSITVIYFLLITIKNYVTKRFDAYLYLATMLFVFLLAQFVDINTARASDSDIGIGAFVFTLNSAIMALLAIKLFFASFEGNTILKPKNVTLIIITAVLQSLLLTMGHLFNTALSTGFIENEVYGSIALIAIIALVLSIIFVIYLVRNVLITIKRQKKQAYNNYAMKIISKIQWGARIIIFGPFIGLILVSITGSLHGVIQDDINAAGDTVGTLISLIGIFLILHNFQDGGIAIFQGDNLRKLIIINKAGVPVYSYTFKHFTDTTHGIQDEQDEDILFSGALTSISMLLGEFTGVKRSVKAISLDKMELLIYKIVDDYSIVLMVEKETRFYRNALSKFSKQVPEMLNELGNNQVFNNNQIKIINGILENSFGQNLDWED